MWGLVQSLMIGKLCQNRSGLLALANNPHHFEWVSREHTIQIFDRWLLLVSFTKTGGYLAGFGWIAMVVYSRCLSRIHSVGSWSKGMQEISFWNSWQIMAIYSYALWIQEWTIRIFSEWRRTFQHHFCEFSPWSILMTLLYSQKHLTTI